MTPGFVQSLKAETKYIADIPGYIEKGLRSGDLLFVKDGAGNFKATVRNVKNGQFVKNFNIVEDVSIPQLGPAMLAAGLFIEIKQIQAGIEKLNTGIEEVLQNFEHDRYARALAAKGKFSQA